MAKSYCGVPALKGLTLEIQAGEVIGLIGENGAGKSTLIKLLSGVVPADAGQIRWLGRSVRFHSPHAAMEAGIATIHQELAFFGQLTVAENLLLGEAWPRYRWGGIRWREICRRAAATLAEFHIAVAPEALFRELSPAQRQEVAIARALCRRARLIILDEPTASLSEQEVEQLFGRLKRFKESGVAILYVSHRLDEVLKLTDRVIVLRDGELVATYPTGGTDLGRMIQDMVGRPLDQVYPHTAREPGPLLLELEGAGRPGLFENLSFAVRAGEIVGLAGLVGSGRSEVARAIFGLYPLTTGQMRLRGVPWNPRGPNEAMRAGLIYVPEERKRQGFVLDHSVSDSTSIGFTDLLARCGLIGRRAEQNRVQSVLETYSVRARHPSQAIGTLSGGNQQKCLLGRWLDRGPDVLLLDEPTRGVDVGAKAEIHALMDRLAGQGRAMLLISSDLPEVVGMSDRVLVLRRGRLVAELSGTALTEANVILAASGLMPTPGREGVAC